MSRNYDKKYYSDSGKNRDGLKAMSNSRNRQQLPDRHHLTQFRVIQRDLVYVIGIPIDIANEETLSKYEYFGQYGPIKKIVVNNSCVHPPFQKPTVSAYVTFQNIEDAWECIYAFENFSLNGHNLKASFGTSKYCSGFLGGQRCTKPDCVYLHHEGDPKDSFNQDEISQDSLRFREMTKPARPPDYYDYAIQDSKPTVFPPRRILTQKKKKPSENPAKQAPQKVEPPKNTFIASLLSAEIHRPIKMNMPSIGYSLSDQLQLTRPTIRVIIENQRKK